MLKLLRCAMVIQYSISVELHRFNYKASPYKRFAGMFYLAYIQIVQTKIQKIEQIDRLEQFLKVSKVILNVAFIKRLLKLQDSHNVNDMIINPINLIIHDIIKCMDVNLIRVSYSKTMDRSQVRCILQYQGFSDNEINALIAYIPVMYDYLEICDDISMVVDIITTINNLVKRANRELEHE